MGALFNSLTGRFLVLTIIFVMLAEVLIFLPSVARFRQEYLRERLERAEIASLTALVSRAEMLDVAVQDEILDTTGVLSVAVLQDGFRELVLAGSEFSPVEETFDLRINDPLTLMRDAIACMLEDEERVVRVVGPAARMEGQLIEATILEPPLKAAIWAYGRNIFYLSLLISVITAALLFGAVRRVIVKPISSVVTSMTRFRDNPEDPSTIFIPSSGMQEMRRAEEALHDMQEQVTASLKEKDRLAQLGGAVARVSHDLRNMLTTATLLVDRIDASEDPAVARTAPKLVASLDRAINLCERTLEFGKAKEPEPAIARIDMEALATDVIEAERLRAETSGFSITADIPSCFTFEGDVEQLFRVITNLCRNARQAIGASGRDGSVTIRARADGDTALIDIVDTGPGLPVKAQKNLFRPFEGGTRRDGTGLGLVIAAELVRGHGGKLELLKTGPGGTTFRITLPRGFPLQS